MRTKHMIWLGVVIVILETAFLFWVADRNEKELIAPILERERD